MKYIAYDPRALRNGRGYEVANYTADAIKEARAKLAARRSFWQRVAALFS